MLVFNIFKPPEPLFLQIQNKAGYTILRVELSEKCDICCRKLSILHLFVWIISHRKKYYYSHEKTPTSLEKINIDNILKYYLSLYYFLLFSEALVNVLYYTYQKYEKNIRQLIVRYSGVGYQFTYT